MECLPGGAETGCLVFYPIALESQEKNEGMLEVGGGIVERVQQRLDEGLLSLQLLFNDLNLADDRPGSRTRLSSRDDRYRRVCRKLVYCCQCADLLRHV